MDFILVNVTRSFTKFVALTTWAEHDSHKTFCIDYLDLFIEFIIIFIITGVLIIICKNDYESESKGSGEKGQMKKFRIEQEKRQLLFAL